MELNLTCFTPLAWIFESIAIFRTFGYNLHLFVAWSLDFKGDIVDELACSIGTEVGYLKENCPSIADVFPVCEVFCKFVAVSEIKSDFNYIVGL